MEERNKVDANDYVNQAIQMLKDLPEIKDSPFTAGYNGVVSLLEYAKESHTASLTKQREGYWQKRCEAAEAVIASYNSDDSIYKYEAFVEDWEQLKKSNNKK